MKRLLTNVPLWALVVGATFLVVIAYVLFLEQLAFPPCCDAIYYIFLAEIYNNQGILNVPEKLRTFAYPLLLTSAIQAKNSLNVPAAWSIFVIQLITFYASVLIATNVARQHSLRLSTFVYLALCLNVFAIPYIGIALTDSMYTSLAIILLALLTDMSNKSRGNRDISGWYVFSAMLLMSLAVTIRPAAIWLCAPLVYCVLLCLSQRRIGWLKTTAAILGGAIPLYFQIFLNVRHFDVYSFFPTMDLGERQIRWGIENFKYATWMGDGSAKNFYPSAPLIDIGAPPYDLHWYFNHPGQAFKLLLMKLVGAFDFDYLMAYPYKKPTYPWLASIFSLSLLWLGCFGVFLHLFSQRLTALGPRLLPLIVFISWGAVNLSSGIELRFTLPLLTYFIIVSCALVDHLVDRNHRRWLFTCVIGWCLVMPSMFWISHLIRLQSVVAR